LSFFDRNNFLSKPIVSPPLRVDDQLNQSALRAKLLLFEYLGASRVVLFEPLYGIRHVAYVPSFAKEGG
jgi:hypothetical protein